MKIDVVLLTKNSIKPCLALCLNSIRKEIPIHRLIVVDGGSVDGTLELIKQYKDLNPLIIVDKKGNRATSRQIGISKVETEFFAFIDSDVILTKGWFNDAIKYFDDPYVGGVWGAAIPIEPRRKKYYTMMTRLYRTTILELAKKQGLVRGMLHDTLLKTEVVKDIQIPPELHVMEDHYVRRHVENKGYKWIATEKPYCLHYVRERSFKDAYYDAYYGWKFRIYDKKWYLKHITLFWAKLLYLLLSTFEVAVVKYELKKELQFLKAMFAIVVGK